MNSSARGSTTSDVEVTHISTHSFWLLVKGQELFMPYEDLPWFKDKPSTAIHNVQQPTPGHFYWAEFDVDLTLASIEHPERYPLKSR